MIAGMLLLYIGMKFGFPFMYYVGCWILIGFNLIRYLTAFINGVKDGK